MEEYGNIYGNNIGYYPIHRKTVNIDTLSDFAEAERLIAIQKGVSEL